MEICPKCGAAGEVTSTNHSMISFDCGSRLLSGKLHQDRSCGFIQGVTKNFAAGHWQEGEPPEESSELLCMFPDAYAFRWYSEEEGWQDENHDEASVEGCLKYAKIKRPNGK